MRLTDAQVAALAATDDCDRDGVFTQDGLIVLAEDVRALAREVQEARTIQAVIATATRDVTARLITPYDALARIVMELASLDSVGTTDGR